MLSNIRLIRAMRLDTVFEQRYEKTVEHALKVGVQGSLVEGCSYGVASGLIYASEALLFYIGAVLISKGTYTYLQMLQVLNLVVFTVSIASQLMIFGMSISISFFILSLTNHLQPRRLTGHCLLQEA